MGCLNSEKESGEYQVNDVSSAQPDEDVVVKDRTCTDVACLIFFLLVLGGMGYVAYRGVVMGQPKRLFYGYDSWGNICGQQNSKIGDVSLSGIDLTDRRKLFFHDSNYFYKKLLPSLGPEAFTLPPVLSGWSPGDPLTSNDPMVCVAECPNVKLETAQDTLYLCSYDEQLCPNLPVGPHRSVLNRCVPNTLGDLVSSNLKGLVAEDAAQKILSDLTNTWKELAYLGAISFGLSLVIMLMLKFMAAILIWTMTILTQLAICAAAGYCWYAWYHSTKQENPTPKQEEAESSWLAYACMWSGFTVITFLILLVLAPRIKLAVELFNEAGSAIGRMPLLLIQPFWTISLLVGAIVGFGYIAACLETAGEPSVDSSTGFVTYDLDKLTKYLRWYHLFGILWVTSFIVACQDMVISGAVCIWYFHNTGNLGSPICQSMKNLIRYHIGTVAFGSLIIAIVRFFRFTMEFIQKRIQSKAGGLAKFFMKIFLCCLWCFEKFLQFMNRNAYIMTACHGYNFFTGAKKAFMLLIANVLRVAALNAVGDFILFLAKVSAGAISLVLAHQLLKEKELNFLWIPVGVAGAVGFAIAHCFMLVYEITLDTIFLCFCEDCQMNDGDTNPYFMSKNLMKCIVNINADASNREKSKQQKKNDQEEVEAEEATEIEVKKENKY